MCHNIKTLLDFRSRRVGCKMLFSISGRTIELMEKNSKVEARGRRRRQSPARWQGCMYEQFMVVYNGIVCMRKSLIFWA